MTEIQVHKPNKICRWCNAKIPEESKKLSYCNDECKKLFRRKWNREHYHIPEVKERQKLMKKRWRKRNKKYYNKYMSLYMKIYRDKKKNEI